MFIRSLGIRGSLGGLSKQTEGVVDIFEAEGLKIFGASHKAAELEASKSFSKYIMEKYGIPTSKGQTFTRVQSARAYVKKVGAPIVVKAYGLAAGKGVILAQTEAEAIAAVDDMLAGNVFGEAGHRVVIEAFLQGEEASFIVMVDGEHCLPLATSQDHKARDNGDTGPNTGGMGAYSPAPVVTPAIHDRVMQEVILPTVRGMAAEGHPYKGVLYAGLMIDRDKIKVLEFNGRFGNPEAQPLLPQKRAEIMAGRVPLNAREALMPGSLKEVVIGPATASEIRLQR